MAIRPDYVGFGYQRAVYCANKQPTKYQGSTLIYDYDDAVGESVIVKRCVSRFDYNGNLLHSLRKQVEPVRCTYHLNKRRIREKMVAYARLKRSKQHLYFYSISFPRGINDADATKVFNTWRTRCSRDFGFNSFIRVNERQSNGTIHFHILTNNRMNVKDVNRVMGVTISNLGLLKYWSNGASMEVSQYHGVDVKKVKTMRGLLCYMTKYVTKSDGQFECRASSMSRDVSSLFTSVTLPYSVEYDYRGNSDFYTYESDWCSVVYCRKSTQWGEAVGKALKELDDFNEWVVKYVFKELPPCPDDDCENGLPLVCSSEQSSSPPLLYDCMDNVYVDGGACPF